MKFIYTADGAINVDRVVRVAARERTNGKGPNTTVWYQEGSEVVCTTAFLEGGVFELTQMIVPASSGFHVVIVEADEPFEVWHAPVVAWRVDPNDAMPVTAGDNLADYSNEWAILCPGGRVIQPGVATHESQDAFRLAVAERRKARAVLP